MSENENAAFTATMKAGPGFADPWIVVRGDTAAQINARLREVWTENVGGNVIATAEALHKEYKTTPPTPGSAGVQPDPAYTAPVQAVVAAVDGTVIDQGPTPAPSNNQAAPAPGGQQGVETDKWGGSYEWNHAKAPQTQYGPKVLKRAISQAGKPYSQWLDPRDKKIPSIYRANGGQNPVDLIEPEFARGV